MTDESKQPEGRYRVLRNPKLQKNLMAWFDLLHGHQEDKRQKPSSGELARLKRADGVGRILLTDGFRRLWFSLRDDASIEEDDMTGWAIVASILAHIKDDDQQRFAERAGQSPNGRPAVHPLRFQQLLAVRHADELHIRLKRQLALIDHRCNVLHLADDLLCWQRELAKPYPVNPKKSIAVQWALAYYAKIPEQTA